MSSILITITEYQISQILFWPGTACHYEEGNAWFPRAALKLTQPNEWYANFFIKTLNVKWSRAHWKFLCSKSYFIATNNSLESGCYRKSKCTRPIWPYSFTFLSKPIQGHFSSWWRKNGFLSGLVGEQVHRAISVKKIYLVSVTAVINVDILMWRLT